MKSPKRAVHHVEDVSLISTPTTDALSEHERRQDVAPAADADHEHAGVAAQPVRRGW